ncbi:MAG: hypothetical protein EXS35_16150 [Pedosphaera sp.]|nr:hypothetical protein [Pedosphaera sp.]
MEKTIKVLNDLEKRRLMAKYAIGGAVAVLFYAEPVLTYDLDIYCFLPEPNGRFVMLSPIYEFLKQLGYHEDKEHVLIEGVPVQFIPAYNELVVEAVAEAVAVKFKRTPARVTRVEHLLAIMLQTDRPKDRARITHLLAEAKIDARRLNGILKRHGLSAKWRKFKQRHDEN